MLKDLLVGKLSEFVEISVFHHHCSILYLLLSLSQLASTASKKIDVPAAHNDVWAFKLNVTAIIPQVGACEIRAQA